MTGRDEISEILCRYCRAIDRLDEALLGSCFHPDATHDHGYAGPSSEFRKFALAALQPLVATHHQLGNISIEIAGDTAFTECYFTAYHRIPPGVETIFGTMPEGGDVIIAGRYVDRFAQRGGAWRIVHRIGVHDWRQDFAPCDAGFFNTQDGRGARDKSDPVYRIRLGTSFESSQGPGC
jgi:hypothetical protein